MKIGDRVRVPHNDAFDDTAMGTVDACEGNNVHVAFDSGFTFWFYEHELEVI